jgi:hypothetical protein
LITQAREALSPLLDLTDLRRMDSSELRAMARAFRDKHSAQFSSHDQDPGRQRSTPSLEIEDVNWDNQELLTAQPPEAAPVQPAAR